MSWLQDSSILMLLVSLLIFSALECFIEWIHQHLFTCCTFDWPTGYESHIFDVINTASTDILLHVSWLTNAGVIFGFSCGWLLLDHRIFTRSTLVENAIIFQVVVPICTPSSCQCHGFKFLPKYWMWMKCMGVFGFTLLQISYSCIWTCFSLVINLSYWFVVVFIYSG